MSKLQSTLAKLLDTFFHLPTLLVLAIIALIIFWQMYGLGFNLGHGFVRLNSNRGSLTLHWTDGCCELNW